VFGTPPQVVEESETEQGEAASPNRGSPGRRGDFYVARFALKTDPHGGLERPIRIGRRLWRKSQMCETKTTRNAAESAINDKRHCQRGQRRWHLTDRCGACSWATQLCAGGQKHRNRKLGV